MRFQHGRLVSSDDAEAGACATSAGMRIKFEWLRKFIAVQPRAILFIADDYIGRSRADFMRFNNLKSADLWWPES